MFFSKIQSSVADLSPIFFILMQFSEKRMSNNKLTPPGVGTTFWGILDPPLGSALARVNPPPVPDFYFFPPSNKDGNG